MSDDIVPVAMVMVPSRPITALAVVIVGCGLVAALYAASGRSSSVSAEQLSDALEHSLNSTAIATDKPAQPVAFCNATGDCTGNRSNSHYDPLSCRPDWQIRPCKIINRCARCWRTCLSLSVEMSGVCRQSFECKVDRADSRWGYEIALQPAEDAKLGTKFAREFACGMARELSVAAFEGIMLMCVRPSLLLSS